MPPRDPQISIVVRSYNRLPALCELLDALLAQRHDSFEIVVVEQSTRRPAGAEARLAVLASDPRVRLLRHPPLGGARARNVGVAAARGELVLLIDDDDLPAGPTWAASLAAAFDDPACLAVSGRQLFGERDDAPYLDEARASRRTLSFTPLLRLPVACVRHRRRRIPVEAVHGTNGAIRRSAFERFGGWDEDTRIEDEASFGLRAARLMQPGEYFAYDPRAVVRRRRDVAGGLDKRYLTGGEYLRRFLDFIHRIIGRYHRARVVALYPLYVLAAYALAVAWIWQDSQRHASAARRAGASLALLATLPIHVARCLARLWISGGAAGVPGGARAAGPGGTATGWSPPAPPRARPARSR